MLELQLKGGQKSKKQLSNFH